MDHATKKRSEMGRRVLRALCASFRLDYRYRYRLFGVFGSETIIIVIVTEVISALLHRNVFGFDIQRY